MRHKPADHAAQACRPCGTSLQTSACRPRGTSLQTMKPADHAAQACRPRGTTSLQTRRHKPADPAAQSQLSGFSHTAAGSYPPFPEVVCALFRAIHVP
ncbi:hypothetical protein ACOMHN_035058 [Nucella lapillus]